MNAATTSQRIRIELPGRPVNSGPLRPLPSSIPSTELFELNAAAARSKQKRPYKTIKYGSVELPIYKCGDRRYMLIWREGNIRKMTRRSELADIIELGEQKAKDLANGQIYMSNMTQAHRATFERVVENLAPTGKSPEVATSEYAMQICKLKSANLQISLDAVVDDYIARASRTRIVPITCPNLADLFIEAKRNGTYGAEHCGAKWLRILESQLKRFKSHFKCPIKQVTSEALKIWLNSIGGAAFTRKGYRTAVSGLVSYAKANNYLPEDWKVLSAVPIPKTGRIKKSLYKPEELIRLLHSAQSRAWSDKMVPFLVCGAFAGIRHEEINPEDAGKVPLDWRDIGPQYIRIGPDTAKNPGDERFIKMSANLIAWLAPYRRRSGPVCTTANTSNALTRIKSNAKLPSGKNQARNILRKSWETYQSAMKEDAKEVSGEAGHSQEVGRRHYITSTFLEEAERWFAIMPPDTEGVLPLDFCQTA